MRSGERTWMMSSGLHDLRLWIPGGSIRVFDLGSGVALHYCTRISELKRWFKVFVVEGRDGGELCTEGWTILAACFLLVELS